MCPDNSNFSFDHSTLPQLILLPLQLGRLDDHYVIRFMKEMLMSMPCKNQGYILDGFPKVYDLAKDLFNSKYL